MAGLPFVLSVIGRDGIEAYAESIRGMIGAAERVAWLAQGRAFDLSFAGDAEAVLKAARAMAGAARLDINVVPAAKRRKKLLIADMDSTIIGCECLDEIADLAGLKDRVAPITEAAMRGEMEFEPALRQRATLLKGLPVETMARVYDDRVRLNPGARALVATMRANGAHTMLVSSGFRYFTQRVAQDCGFETEQANVLLERDGAFTGEVVEPILGRDAKLRALEAAVAELGIDFDDVLAVGDGANDLAMIARAGLGVAWHAKPILAAAASAVIVHGDLTSLLYLQGYREDDIRG
ncbi:MAG TPA: phosphoserine phosphatase SerB [Rhizomicrobium sp.]|jgi:phosphoserine phosphatase